MSRDNPERGRKRDLEKLVEEPRSMSVDTDAITSADEGSVEERPVRRNRAKISKSQRRTNRLKRFVPNGYVHRLADPTDDRIEDLLDQEWSFAKDDHGQRVFETANHGIGDNVPKQVLMIKREEWHKDDQRAKAKARFDRVNARTKDVVVNGVSTNQGSKDPFFRDIGISADYDD